MFREFRMRTMTVTAVSAMKTQALDNAPLLKQEQQIGPNTAITTTFQRGYVPHGVVGYYWCLRVLMNSWGQAGNYEMESILSPGKKVLMMPLSVAIDYADRFLQVVLASSIPEADKLAWGEQKDRLTRSMMAALVRDDGGRYPAQEALELALTKSATDWCTVGGRQIMGIHQDIEELDQDAECSTEANAVPLGRKDRDRQRRSDDHVQDEGFLGKVRKKGMKGDRGKGSKGDKGKGKADKRGEVKIGSMTSQLNNKHFCGKFNSKAGCTKNERDCPHYALHVCSYRTGPGSVCNSFKHGFVNHGQGRR